MVGGVGLGPPRWKNLEGSVRQRHRCEGEGGTWEAPLHASSGVRCVCVCATGIGWFGCGSPVGRVSPCRGATGVSARCAGGGGG